MKEIISRLKKVAKSRYSNDYNYMLGDFNLETETANGYNGRQLLELLQNCDDQACKKVCIELNEQEGTIAVHNDGIPFSEDGYRSLFIPHLSSKTSQQKYIGNKGLGFRSIITWSKSIEIQSNNISLLYSNKNRKKNFDSLFSDEIQQEIRKKNNFNDEVIPLPFLTLPKIKLIEQRDFDTSIIIKYKKKYLKDIKKQLKAITPETILFLKNLEEIEFRGISGRETIKCERNLINIGKKNFSPTTKIDFGDSTWRIFEKEEALPTEFSDSKRQDKEVYQIKIAIEKNFKATSPYLYSFFPTRIKLNQPYILHATFDLDATRNQINDSEKNRYILERIVEFTVQVAKYYTTKKVSYRPLEILYHNHKADTLSELGYYSLIKKAINNEPIFPCIGNSYISKEDALYLSDSFAQMLLDIGGEKHLDIHLIPSGECHEEFINSFKIDKELSLLSEVTDVFNDISRDDLNIRQRAKFIYQLTKNAEFIKTDFPNELALLTNEKGKLIKGEEYIYTPITKNKELKTPKYANIQFINQELFDELVTTFDFKSSESKDRARFIAEKLDGFCNLHSYEPATLARKIISETNQAISDDKKNAKAIIKEMNDCLFHNFLLLEDTNILSSKVSVPLLSQTGKVKNASKLILSKQYPTGNHIHFLFKYVYKSDDFVASPKVLGLDMYESEPIEYERYLIWLGVNKFAKYQFHEEITNGQDDYVIDVLHQLGKNTYTSYSISYKSIDNLTEILSSFSVESLISWIHLDSELKMSLNDDENEDFFRYYYYSLLPVYKKYSFIKYTIIENHVFDFKNYLIDDKYSWVNQQPINYNHDTFKRFQISKTEINEILMRLGATDEFMNLSIKRVTEILNILPVKFPNGNKSQTLYKKALSHYKLHQIEIEDNILLFADDGSGLKTFPQDKVFFSDRVKLPKRLYQDFPVFNFPSRAGGADAIDFFGLNDLGDIEISIVEHQIHEDLSKSFNKYLTQLKPSILAHRINEIEEIKQQKTSASICRELNIILCESLTFTVNNREYELSNYEYIQKEAYTYFVRIRPNDTIESLRRNRFFTQSFVDIVSISFDVYGEKNEFRYMLRSSVEDVIHGVITDFGEENYFDSRNLLGLADHKQAFWQALFLSKGIEYNEELDDLSLEQMIDTLLGFKVNVGDLDYGNLNRDDELIKIQDLFINAKLTLEAFNAYFIGEISFSTRHFNSIKNEILKKKQSVKQALWFALKEKDISRQEQFLNLIQEMEMSGFYDYAMEIAAENKYEFEIELQSVVSQYIEQKYGDLNFADNIDLLEVIKLNTLKFSEEEIDEIEGNTNWKSLLYFNSALSVLKERVNQKLSLSGNTVIRSGNQPQTLILKEYSILIPSNSPSYKGKSKAGVYSPSYDEGKNKKKKGDSNEERVYQYMKNNDFKNVDWVSRDNEGLHCDIRYTGTHGKVKYVEVKSFDSGYFYLSKDEYEFGESEKANYEIWLVRNNSELLPPIKDFFSNPMYEESLVANEFKVYLTIMPTKLN